MDSADTTHHSGVPSRPNQDDSATPFLKLAVRAASYLGNRNCSAPAALLIACWTILGSRVQANNLQDPFVVVRTTQRVTPVRISSSSKVSTCTGDQKECEEIDRGIRDRANYLYQNYCEPSESGRIFDIQMEEIRIQGNAATVSYVLVLFESCEEGAPYRTCPQQERWVRSIKEWEFKENAKGTLERDQTATVSSRGARASD
jgi:hypothetical protein